MPAIRTSELTGAALDWAVAKCEGEVDDDIDDFCLSEEGEFAYTTDWAQGGPIIERERIRIDCPWNPGSFEATCKIDGVTAWVEGDTVLTAAMRCYVASKLGDKVEIPEELLP